MKHIKIGSGKVGESACNHWVEMKKKKKEVDSGLICKTAPWPDAKSGKSKTGASERWMNAVASGCLTSSNRSLPAFGTSEQQDRLRGRCEVLLCGASQPLGFYLRIFFFGGDIWRIVGHDLAWFEWQWGFVCRCWTNRIAGLR